jgi:hypothetical protein
MLLNKVLLLALLASCAAGVSFAGPISCPDSIVAQASTAPLEGASVFEGKPENQVDLIPDLQNSEWDIALNQKHARQRGESMFLVCRYERTKNTVTLEIPRDSTLCKVEGTTKGLAAWCNSPVRRTTKKH